MELEELKKSWLTLDKHLEDKVIINEEAISRLIQHTNQNVKAINRFSSQLRILSLCLLGLTLVLFNVHNYELDIYFRIILLALMPALAWDWFVSNYLAKTKTDELPISSVIFRFNKIHRWILLERLIGLVFLLTMAVFMFFHFQLQHSPAPIILIFIFLCIAGICFVLWMYKKTFLHLRTIKKNLAELKELKE